MKQSFYKLRMPDDIVNLIREMHPHLKKKIKASLQTILNNPDSGKCLKDDLAGLWSFRVSKFRIIYKIQEGKYMEIVAIGPRKNIYEETYRIISRIKDTKIAHSLNMLSNSSGIIIA